MMILDASLGDAERMALISEIEAELAQSGAKIVKNDHPGERELAYKIHGSQTGYYLLYTLEKESGDFTAATAAFNIKTSIFRFMFVKIEE